MYVPTADPLLQRTVSDRHGLPGAMRNEGPRDRSETVPPEHTDQDAKNESSILVTSQYNVRCVSGLTRDGGR